MQNAKKLPKATLMERYLIFVREQEQIQKAFSASCSDGSTSNDLSSYIEYQRNFNLVVQLHTEALVARRFLWQSLMHSSVTFSKIEFALREVDRTSIAAQKMYVKVLSQHSTNAKIVALYVRFLEGVRNDPWATARWSAELEKLERAEDDSSEL
jgi:hypothetical protein